MKDINDFYLSQKEPIKSCYLALRDIILACDENITTQLKYGMPFFSYKGKMFTYFWFHKTHKKPYIGVVEGNRIDHPALLQENRSRMKILLIDPNEDIPKETITSIVSEALNFYKNGTIKTPKK